LKQNENKIFLKGLHGVALLLICAKRLQSLL